MGVDIIWRYISTLLFFHISMIQCIIYNDTKYVDKIRTISPRQLKPNNRSGFPTEKSSGRSHKNLNLAREQRKKMFTAARAR